MTNKDLQVSVHGPAVTIEDAIEAGAATKELLDALTEQVAPGEGLKWRVTSIQFKCDGCGLLRPDRPGPDEGWTYRDGWAGVAKCESGGDWQANTGDGYEGGLQFAPSTWAAEGGREYAEHAYDATEAQQIEVAERLLRTAGIGSWPVCGRYLKAAA